MWGFSIFFPVVEFHCFLRTWKDFLIDLQCLFLNSCPISPLAKVVICFYVQEDREKAMCNEILLRQLAGFL